MKTAGNTLPVTDPAGGRNTDGLLGEYAALDAHDIFLSLFGSKESLSI